MAQRMFLNFAGHFVAPDMLTGYRERIPREASLKGTPKAGRGHWHLRCKCRCEGQSPEPGGDHHPKPDEAVTADWREVVAIGRARDVPIAVPRAAAHHPASQTDFVLSPIIGFVWVWLEE